MRLSRAAIAAVLICITIPVAAQDPRGRGIAAFAGTLPASGIYCDDGTNHAVICPFALLAPADDLAVITPSDTVALSAIPKALYVASTGTLAVKGASGTTVSLGTVGAGQVIPIRARYVMATGTTATVVGLF